MAPARSGAERRRRRIGLFGGTFNPVHRGHLRAAQAALEKLRLDEVIFLPNSRPALKSSKELLSGPARLRLLRLALKGKKKFKVDGQEIKRGGVSYTIDTLKAYRKKWKNNARLFFLLGPDAARGLPKWKDALKLSGYAEFYVLSRPGKDGKAVDLDAGLIKRFHLKAVKTPLVPVSSSLIRRLMKEGKSVKELIPPNR